MTIKLLKEFFVFFLRESQRLARANCNPNLVLVCDEYLLIFCKRNKAFATRLKQTFSHKGWSIFIKGIPVLVIRVANATICLLI